MINKRNGKKKNIACFKKSYKTCIHKLIFRIFINFTLSEIQELSKDQSVYKQKYNDKIQYLRILYKNKEEIKQEWYNKYAVFVGFFIS